MPVLNKNEFKLLFDAHFEDLRNYVFYRCGDSELATDIAQDVFLKVWEKKLDVYKKREMGLLVKIANDMVISNYRKIQNGQKFRNSIHNHEDNITPEDNIIYNELNFEYEKALNDLGENERVAFLMNRVEGLKYAEIAQKTGISVKAVEKRMSKALEFLRARLLQNQGM